MGSLGKTAHPYLAALYQRKVMYTTDQCTEADIRTYRNDSFPPAGTDAI